MYIVQLFQLLCLLQLMEKAENREKERLKEETKKVSCCCRWWDL